MIVCARGCLRAYGQRDPLVEYKREAFALFDSMTEAIKGEAIGLLFRVQVVREEKMRSEPGAPRAQYLHPESGGMKKTAERAYQNVERGLDTQSHFAPRQSAPDQKPEPIHRESPKVGRNDPCPCGSGKKYKKCCGVNE